MDVIANYNKDVYAWLMKNTDLLCQHKFNEVDIDHVAEELEAMGRGKKRVLTSHLSSAGSLLKWNFQPALHPSSWKNTILTKRIDIILELFEDSPFTFEQLLKKDYLPEDQNTI